MIVGGNIIPTWICQLSATRAALDQLYYGIYSYSSPFYVLDVLILFSINLIKFKIVCHIERT